MSVVPPPAGPCPALPPAPPFAPDSASVLASPPRARRRRRAGSWLPLAVAAATLVGCAAAPRSGAGGAGASGQASARVAPDPSRAASEPAPPSDPSARLGPWLDQLRVAARAAGITEATLDSALREVKLRPKAVVQDQAQPEFTRPLWDYLDAVISPQRVATGQQKLQQFQTEAEAARLRDGVPGPVLMAVWGIESNFGRNYGDVPVFDALVTLGVEGRREAWARNELLAALRIVQNGDIAREQMVGSWAGAMGQTQFLPSSYLAYAVDADGDGRRDIWGSMPDVLASTANFLGRSGWRADEPCAHEVTVPQGFDAARADTSVRQDAQAWAGEGLRGVDGSALPPMSRAWVLQPAGARGPAWLVGENFRALLRYNNATSYALTVCLLAQRIGGGPGVQTPWPRELRALVRGEVLTLQNALNRLGFDSGTPDGQVGPATRSALRRYQRSQGLVADGFPTVELLQRLQQTP